MTRRLLELAIALSLVLVARGVTAQTCTDQSTKYEVAVADFTGDTLEDVYLRPIVTPESVPIPYALSRSVSRTAGYRPTLLVGSAGGAFTVSYDPTPPIVAPGTPGLYQVHEGDFDGDGRPDFFLQPSLSSRRSLMIGGQGIAAAPQIRQVIPNPSLNLDLSAQSGKTLCAQDLDGDGRADILVTQSGQPDRALFSDGDGTFVALVPRTACSVSGATDTDCDGVADRADAFSLNPNETIDTDDDGIGNAADTDIDGDGVSNAADVAPLDLNDGNTAGATPATFSVTRHGKALYSIPLTLIPSVANIAPELSLVYDGTSGNHLAGMGWYVEGLPMITRCENTLVQDTFINAVNFDTSDRFCLSGQRLVLTSGTYGADGAVYRTEHDSHARVVSTGSTGGSPTSFTVRRPNGEIETYGGTTDSQRASESSPRIHAWALSRIEDREGNYVTFTYAGSATSGEHYITRIDYSGNTAAGLSPQNSVRFAYQVRNDVTPSYAQGTKSVVARRLTAIETYRGEQWVRRYSLAYAYPGQPTSDYDGVGGRSRLKSVTECVPDVGCKLPTVFTWDTRSPNHQFTPEVSETDATSLPVNAANVRYLYGDVNGDGKTDLVVTYRNGDNIGRVTYLARATGDGFTLASGPTQETGFTASIVPDAQQEHLLGDVNGDGKADLIWVAKHNNSLFRMLYLANAAGTGFSPTAGWEADTDSAQYAGAVNNRFLLGDVDGDGRADLTWVFSVGNNNMRRVVYLARPGTQPGMSGVTTLTKFTAVVTDLTLSPGAYTNNQFLLGDVNGDKKDDLIWTFVLQNQLYRILYLATANGTGFVRVSVGVDTDLHSPASPYSNQQFLMGDVNGDGKADLVWTYSYTNQFGRVTYLADPLGTSFTRKSRELETDLDPNHSVGPKVRLAEIDGDGKTDLVYAYNDSIGNLFHWVVFLSNTAGEGFTRADSGTLGTNLGATHEYQYADVSGDGVSDLVWTYHTTANAVQRQVFRQPTSYPDHIAQIVDGLGNQTTIQYNYLAGWSGYAKGTVSTYPTREDSGRGYVVSHVEQSNGIGTVNAFDYAYTAARTHLSGRGFLGFATRRITDVRRGFVTTETYRQDFPLVGELERRVTTTTGGTPVPIEKLFKHFSIVPTAPATSPIVNPQLQFTAVKDSAELRYELNGGALVSATVVQNTWVAATGNLTDSRTTTGSTFNGLIDASFDAAGSYVRANVTTEQRSVLTHNDFTVDTTANWRPGFLNTQTVTHDVPDVAEPDRVVVTSFTPWSSTSYLTETDTHFSGTNVATTNAVLRDSFGNVTQTTTTGSDIDGGTIVPQVTSAGPYVEGLYPQTKRNALNQPTQLVFDARTGVLVKETDANGLVTDYAYDGFGREVLKRTPDGVNTQTSYGRCRPGAVSCPALAKTRVTVRVSHPRAAGKRGTPSRAKYLDAKGREVRSEQIAFDGRSILADTSYDELGRVTSAGEPYFAGDPAFAKTFTHDALDRVDVETHPDGGTLNHDYTSDTAPYSRRETLTEHIVDLQTLATKNVVSFRQSNALGQVVRVVDALNTPLTMTYDAQGNLSVTTVNGNAATRIDVDFDVAGNRIRIDDPDARVVTMEYDSMARLRRKKHAPTTAVEAVEVTTYDVLGRMKTRLDQQPGSPSVTSTWNYDPPGATGLLGGIVTSDSSYTESRQYDGLTRLVRTETTLAGLAETQVVIHGYDVFSRDVFAQYPSGFAARHTFNGNGYESQVRDASNGALLWQANLVNARSQTESETLGNGLTTGRVFTPATGRLETIRTGAGAAPTSVQNLSYFYDTHSNVKERRSARPGESFAETFTYDDLHRVKTANTTGLAGGNRNSSYDYDVLGNITTKSGTSDPNGYQYGQNGGGVHAVSRVTLAGANRNYSYDARGNMITADARTISYSAFDKPTQIAQPSSQVDLRYAPDRSLSFQSRVDGAVTTETFYVEGGRYEHVRSGNQIRLKCYVGGFMVHTVSKLASGATGTEQFSFLHRDHLGSVESVTDGGSLLRTRYNFAPFGSRRNEDWGDADAAFLAGVSAKTLETTTDGFTGHEHLDSVGLVHMGGRVYEPDLGRFLSPDPLVQNPLSSQSYNRYSYVMNNPLRLVDPSGFASIDVSASGGSSDSAESGAASGSESMSSSEGSEFAVSPDLLLPERNQRTGFQAEGATNAADANLKVKTENKIEDKRNSTLRSERKAARRAAVIAGGGERFQIADNPHANDEETFNEFPGNGNAAVKEYAKKIEVAAKGAGIDPNLLKTVVYMENSRGWYDRFTGPLNKSIRPANVHVEFWGPALNLTRAQLTNVDTNLRAGARIISGIEAHLGAGDVRALGTLYNSIGETQVTDYGARFGRIYTEKPWETR